MGTLKRQKADGAWEYVQSIGNNFLNDLNDWKNFKAMGGKIDGDLQIRQKMRSQTSYLELLTGNDFGITIDDNGKRVVPKVNNGVSLGAEAYRFKDVWTGSYSKAINGYTNLPNGLILQWGKVVPNIDVSAMQWVNYPIAFPNGVLSVTGTTSAYDSNTNPRLITSEVFMNNKNNFKYRIMKIGLPYESTIATVEIWWMAIGY